MYATQDQAIGEFDLTSSIVDLVHSSCTLEAVLDHPELQKELRKDGEKIGMTNAGQSTLPDMDEYISPVASFLMENDNLVKMVTYLVDEPKNIPTETSPGTNPLHQSLNTEKLYASIYEMIPRITLTDFAPLPRDSLCVHLREHYHDKDVPGENTWCRLTLDPPQETDPECSSAAIYKYPYLIHEILTELNRRLLNEVSNNDEALAILFKLFSRRKPLNPVLLGYASSMISTLIAKTDLTDFLAIHEEEILEDLFFHLENRSVAEILKMLIFEERGKIKDHEAILMRLFDCMDLSLWPCDVLVGERQENVFLIIRELIHSDKTCHLHNKYMHIFMSSDIPERLMEAVFHWHKNTVTSSIGIMVELLMYLDPTPEEEIVPHHMEHIDSYGNITFVDASVMNDFGTTTDLEVPAGHRYMSNSSESVDECLREDLIYHPPIYPLEPWADNPDMTEKEIEEYYEPYHAIWTQYDQFFTSNNLLPIDEYDNHMHQLTMDNCSSSLHDPMVELQVEQSPAPPKLYKSSGEFFDRRLRKYMGRLLVQVLEPLTSAAVAHRDRRRNKSKDPKVKGRVQDDEEYDLLQDAEFYQDGSVSPCARSPTGGVDLSTADFFGPATESCEPMREDLYRALYPDPESPSDPALDPYFTLDWYIHPDRLPPCDPSHNALMHLIDVLPPEYIFSEYQDGRKVAYGLVQNAFQNGIRPVVGHRLLEILHLFRAFIRIQGSTTFHLYIPKILKCAHSLLFAHKWNSILHISLGDIIIYAIQRGPGIWPDAISHFIVHSGFFGQAARLMRRYLRYKKESNPEARRARKMKLHSGALPIVLEILRIFQDLSKHSAELSDLIRITCPEWISWEPLLEDLNVDSVEWGAEPVTEEIK